MLARQRAAGHEVIWRPSDEHADVWQLQWGSVRERTADRVDRRIQSRPRPFLVWAVAAMLSLVVSWMTSLDA